MSVMMFQSREGKRRSGYCTACLACSHLCRNAFHWIRSSLSPQFEQPLIYGVEIMEKTFSTSVLFDFVFKVCLLVFILKPFTDCPVNFSSSTVTLVSHVLPFRVLYFLPWLPILAGKLFAKGELSWGLCVVMEAIWWSGFSPPSLHPLSVSLSFFLFFSFLLPADEVSTDEVFCAYLVLSLLGYNTFGQVLHYVSTWHSGYWLT